MYSFKHHFEPLRPNRADCGNEKYEFTHGNDSVWVYDIKNLDPVCQIAVGERPDCHATTIDNKYVYIACKQGLYCISQESLEVVRILDTGHVYGTNMLPDGDTMLLHDAFGGIFVIKNICNPQKAYIHKLVQVREWNDKLETLGVKGDFLVNYRYYLCNGWTDNSMYLIDTADDYSVSAFISSTTDLSFSDDLVVSKDRTLAFSACYAESGYIAVTDIRQKKVINKILSGKGTCGLTMTGDKRYIIASNDGEASVTVIDTADLSKKKYSAQDAFNRLEISSRIQGISCGTDDCVYVYDCGGEGAIVRFYPFVRNPYCEVSYSGGYCKTGEKGEVKKHGFY